MPARYETLASWANELGWSRGSELGIFDGRTFLYLLENCPNLSMTGVDVWDMPGFVEGATKSGERCFCPYCTETRAARSARTVSQMKAEFFIRVARYPLRSTVYIEPTTRAALRVPDGALDFVFIDGDHSTEGVGGDIAAWRAKVRPGGRVIGHDANMKSVMRGALKHFAAENVRFNDDHLWWVQV